MPKPRKQQISLADTPYYHCISRCVRRSFLCGKDTFTGKSYEHRRHWVEDRLFTLADVFAINICAFAVMSNHTHVVLHVDKSVAESWSTEEVILRWHSIARGTLLTQKYANIETRQSMLEVELNAVETAAEVYRQRLYDISWFMRLLNEYIAREANKEDNCTGRFWEGRFKSQALLDESALAACMAYVDLNPIRANMASTPETSNHTSIQQRINSAKAGKQPNTLLPFIGNPRQHMPKGLAFNLKDYIELVELTGRVMREDKAGFINQNQQPILARLRISKENWLALTTQFENTFSGAAGTEQLMHQFRNSIGAKRINGIGNSKRLFGSG